LATNAPFVYNISLVVLKFVKLEFSSQHALQLSSDRLMKAHLS